MRDFRGLAGAGDVSADINRRVVHIDGGVAHIDGGTAGHHGGAPSAAATRCDQPSGRAGPGGRLLPAQQ